MKRINEYFSTNTNKRSPVPAIPIAEEESSLICDTINSEEPGTSSSNVVMSRVNDVGMFIKVDRNLTDNEKHIVLTNAWIPPVSYSFPILEPNKERKLKFQHHWLTSYSWLLYSEIKSGAFCRFCVVFAKCGGVGNQKLGFLSSEPFNNWKKAKEVFNKHSLLEYHKTAALKADSFLSVFSKKQKSIVDALDDDRSKQIINNRKRLLPIVECIILCGKQEIALRGHRDFGPIDFTSASAKNEGNFREILKYKVKDDDCIRSFLESDSRNKYLSPRIQNEIIAICGDVLLKKIVEKINASKCFSVLADETTDISVTEQLTICVRYLSGTGNDVQINEDFIMFVEIHSLTGVDLASAILNGLNVSGINCDFLYGQGYDGAANMSGQFKGVKSIIQAKYPKALYVHCVAHSLNLAVSSACDLQPIRICLGVIEKLYCFFNTPKRKNALFEAISNSDLIPSIKSLKRLCATRWIQRYDAVNDFVQLFPYVVVSLETMSSWKDVTAVEANMLRNAMDSEFLISVQIIKVLFSYGLPLCKQLQSKDIDLKEMVGLAEDNVNALKQLRTNIEPEFKKIFDEAQKMAEVLDFQIVVKRINKRQINRANPSLSSEEPEDYFRVTICIPYIESFINQLELRFLEHHNIFKGFYCLFDNNEDSNEADFESLVSFYLTHHDLSTTLGELKMWKLKP
ncbi:zinc finger MYM-type protein 1-like [Metopolophium dirhodum]|uniref:zinc finger MYM-type protein 1-like n=1 Tax=Metopolophium dirhodum TaxID=44670 RepID=UPI00298F8BB4|nr:zinc finger MYM-type protein 1-like [Metopolophium dirhodum]